jgi:hypothetical protein
MVVEQQGGEQGKQALGERLAGVGVAGQAQFAGHS